MRFAESLLAKRVLITEGNTEASCYSAIARHLSEIAPSKYQSFEAMGVAIFNAESETSIPIYGEFFAGLGKDTFAIFDKQSDTRNLKKIEAAVDHAYESEYAGFEKLIIEETDSEILLDYAQDLLDNGDWPTHIPLDSDVRDMDEDDFQSSLFSYLTWQKAKGSASEIISLCKLKQLPTTLKKQIRAITEIIQGGDETL